MANKYKPGTEVYVRFTVTDISGNLYDPSGVKFHYTQSDGTDVTRVYNTHSEVTRISTGLYQCAILVPYSTASYGRWHYDAQVLTGGVERETDSGYFDVTRLETLE